MSTEDSVRWLENNFGKYPFSVIFTNIFAFIFGILIVWLCFRVSVGNPLDQVFNLLLTLIGALLGWTLGMFFAPYDKAETARFSSIGQSVSVFVSGYVVSKLDRFLELTMFGDDKLPVTMTWVRIGLLFSALLLAMLWVFSNRAYFRASDSKTAATAGTQTASTPDA